MATRDDYSVGTQVVAMQGFKTSGVDAGEIGVVEAHHLNGITVRWNKAGAYKSALDWRSAFRMLKPNPLNRPEGDPLSPA